MISATNLNHLHYPTSHSLVRTHEFRVWRRRRLKLHTRRRTSVSCGLGFPNENLLHNLIPQLPSLNWVELLAPVMGLASGAALYLSRLRSKSNRNLKLSGEIGEWILFTSPTPFNRFVFLRCPSITLERGTQFLDDSNEKVVSGRIIGANESDTEDVVVYQRTCVGLPDGGVVALDWPDNLDLREERGMDTTVVIVPGTTEGSMDKEIMSFVNGLLKCGYFPVVMNPRGCAGSPLTTPRLFSAADSDDICTALQFLNKARPWNTLVAVGCGLGANMLTKYLAEVAERTPLTAAACIDNPFDLEEVTKSFPYHAALDQKLTSGLTDILRFNKELFQGRAKGFDVEKALSATSLRDFEREISMVSYGFESIEDFYSKSSTRELVGNVKIPLLFIQSDDGTAPPFSIPRSSVAENPFTSMLLCSCLLSTITRKKSLLPWCQHFAVEWLIAVELGLLKGRHPLLKDVDVAINPSAGLALVESSTSNENSAADSFLNDTDRDTSNGYPVGSTEDGMTINAHLGSERNISEGAESLGENNEILEQKGLEDTTLVNEAEQSPTDDERSQALDSARVVMNMLDVTMPGTIQEEQKKKVLLAMEQGETLMKALECALPEDVREKLTTAVSEIVNTQGTKLNLDGIMNISLASTASEEVKSKMQETVKEFPSAAAGFSDTRSQEQMKVVDEMPDGDKNDPEMPDDADKNEPEMEKHPGMAEVDIPSEPVLENSFDQGQAQTGNSSSDETPNSGGKEANELEQENVNDGNDTTQMNMEDDSHAQTNDETNMDVSNEKNKPTSVTKVEESVSPGKSLAPSVMEEESNHSQEEDKNIAPTEDQNNQGSSKSEEPSSSSVQTPNPPSFNVSQALDALTGFDDSTQVAVNSVFGVLENMIAKLEEDNGQENDGKQEENDGKQEESEDEEPKSAEVSPVSNKSDDTSVNKEPNKSRLSIESDNLDKFTDLPKDVGIDSDERQLTPSFSTSLKKSSGISSRNGTNSVNNQENKKINDMTDLTLATKTSGAVGSISKLPRCVTVNPFGDSMYNEYLRRYLLSQIPNGKPLDFNSTADLLLDYFPEDGQWKLLDQTENTQDPGSGSGTGTPRINGMGQGLPSLLHDSDAKEIIETSYVIVDRGKKQQPIKGYKIERTLAEKPKEHELKSELECSVKNIILDSLKVEVGRRLGLADMEEMESNLAVELERVAEVVSRSLQDREELTGSPENELTSGKAGPPFGEYIIQTISLAVSDSIYLKKVLPVGVIVGSSLAALKKYYNVSTLHDNSKSRGRYHDHPNNVEVTPKGPVSEVGSNELVINGSTKDVEKHGHPNSAGKKLKGQVNDVKGNELVIDNPVKSIEKHEAVNNNTVMAGAVTAALGASALFVGQQSQGNSNESVDVSSGFVGATENNSIKHENVLDVGTEKNQNHMVSSLAEKAMSVAGPVVPTKSDGGLDQERLVAMLSDLGQKGGILRMVGKLALLWGGIRGAVSLTDRLISFLHIAERPLYQRLLAFACMVLVLWSPVVIPMFPTLVQGWSSHTSNGIAEYACVIGLYTAVTILIILWGKRIRGYKDPLEQYGLDLTSRTKFLDFLKGLLGGIMLVLSIHSINTLLGCAHFSCYSSLPSSSTEAMELLKAFGRLLVLSGRGIMTATVVVIVEEILFRSWLPEEISVDFGYHRSIIISGFVFAVLQRSLRSTPGLWLLSVALSGLRQRSEGSLSIPIGFRAGILSSSFILRTSGFLVYHSRYPLWVAGRHPLQPFDGGVGLSICIMLAILLYPKQPLGTKKIQRTIRE